MLDQARSAVVGKAPATRFITADVCKLPLNDNQFDVVLASSLLEYVDPLERALAEIRRVMRTDGLFICSVPNPRSYYRRMEGVALRWTGRPSYRRHVNEDVYRRDVAAMLNTAGFDLVKAQQSGLPPLVGGGKLAAIAERHPLLATMMIYFARAV